MGGESAGAELARRPSGWRRGLPFAVVAAGLALIFWQSGRAERDLADQKAPNVLLPIIGARGARVSLDALSGRHVALVFWSNRDRQVDRALRFWQRMLEQHGEERLAVVGIVIDDDEADVLKHARELKLTYPHARADDAVLGDYGIEGVPVSILVDPDGWVRLDYRGWRSTTAGQLTDAIERLLGVVR